MDQNASSEVLLWLPVATPSRLHSTTNTNRLELWDPLNSAQVVLSSDFYHGNRKETLTNTILKFSVIAIKILRDFSFIEACKKADSKMHVKMWTIRVDGFKAYEQVGRTCFPDIKSLL